MHLDYITHHRLLIFTTSQSGNSQASASASGNSQAGASGNSQASTSASGNSQASASGNSQVKVSLGNFLPLENICLHLLKDMDNQ